MSDTEELAEQMKEEYAQELIEEVEKIQPIERHGKEFVNLNAVKKKIRYYVTEGRYEDLDDKNGDIE